MVSRYTCIYRPLHVRQSFCGGATSTQGSFKGGDASMRFLASSQDEEMATLKDASVSPVLPRPNSVQRGRDSYSLYGVLRTKPGRADSLPTVSMSCSDKIAVWNVLGFQGA